MLVLSRFPDEVIHIGHDVTVMVLRVRGDKVWLGVEAPKNVRVDRAEIFEARAREAAAKGGA